MSTKTLSAMSVKFKQAIYQKSCPECAAPMEKIEHAYEDRTLFIWYQCSRKECDGNWLQKIP